MIRKVTLRRFKRFDEVVFDIPGHVVLAGPNNTGKTTLLQAVAGWALALNRWKQLSDYQRHGGAYTKAPIARQAFSAVPLRAFDLLWNTRDYREPIQIEIQRAFRL
jgi:predicted ATPase